MQTKRPQVNSKPLKNKPKKMREAEKAHNAVIFSEGFQLGYRMGLEEGKRKGIGGYGE